MARQARRRNDDVDVCPSTTATASSGSTARSCPGRDAKLHVLSHGLHYASCVFEGERAYGGSIFKSTEHSGPAQRSAEILDFTIPYSVAELDAAKQLVLDRNGLKDAYVRPVAWRGSEMMAVAAQRNTIHVAIADLGMAEHVRHRAPR